MESNMKLLEIIWEDSNACHGWTNDLARSAIAVTVGYLLNDNENDIVITSTLGMNSVLCPVAIPKTCIKSIKLHRSKCRKEFTDERDQRLNSA